MCYNEDRTCVQTREWLAGQAQRLVASRKLLERELGKFVHVTAVAERFARHYDGADDAAANFHNPVDPKWFGRGRMNLRRLMEEVCCHLGLQTLDRAAEATCM